MLVPKTFKVKKRKKTGKFYVQIYRATDNKSLFWCGHEHESRDSALVCGNLELWLVPTSRVQVV